HGEDAAQAALAAWRRVHSERLLPAEMPSHVVASPAGLVDLMVQTELAPSKTQARNLIKGGGVSLAGEEVSALNRTGAVPAADGVVLQVGRRKFVRLLPS